MKTLISWVSLAILFPVSCKSQHNLQNNDIQLKKNILELNLKSEKTRRDTLYLHYGLNSLTRKFIEENTLLGDEDLEFHDFRKCLSIDVQKKIFNKIQVESFYKQLDNSNNDIIYLIDLPENNTFSYSPIEIVKNNFKIGVPISTGIYRYILSEPLVTKDREYVLLSYSVGFPNSKTGGIKVYKKNDGGYELLCLLESWIE